MSVEKTSPDGAGGDQYNRPAAAAATVAAGHFVPDIIPTELLAVLLANALGVGISGVVGLRLRLMVGKGHPAGNCNPGQDDAGGDLAEPPARRRPGFS